MGRTPTREWRCEQIEHCLRELARFRKKHPTMTPAYGSAPTDPVEIFELADWFAETGQYNATPIADRGKR